jgi:hypothetical protein
MQAKDNIFLTWVYTDCKDFPVGTLDVGELKWGLCVRKLWEF